MSQFAVSWKLSRQRFVDCYKGLNEEQLQFRLFPGALTLGEMALHVAGVEVSFASQLTDQSPEGLNARLRQAATDGVVNDRPFPFKQDEITPALVARALEAGREAIEPLITNPSEALLAKEIVSALGPVITGEGALARLAFHPAYHQGQAYLLLESPEFPR